MDMKTKINSKFR